jgi:YidC/Oxa1 family membrane protein insertase
VIAAEKAQKELVIKEAKAKELNDKVVLKLQLLLLPTGDSH